MIFKVKLSRLFRKRALDVNCMSRSSSSTVSQSRTLINAVLRTANSPLVVGYFIVFSYSALLAPSSLLAAVFVASIASLLSGLFHLQNELCRYEFLTCRRNTSACPYICTYQIMGEFAAHLYGWIQMLSRGAATALVARGIGSILVLVFEKRLLRYEILSTELINEDSIGVVAQLMVSVFVLLGLKMTTHFTAAIKFFIVVAISIFMSQIGSLTSDLETQHHPSSNDFSSKEEFLMAAALLSMAFKPENKETQILSKSSSMSAFLGIQYCSALFILVIMSIIHCILPISIFSNIKTGSPLLEVMMTVATEPHWSTAIFSCCCIFVGCLTLIEAIQDSKRQITKLSSDGLILKKLATNPKLALLVHCLISIPLQLTISTLNLIFILAFVHLWLDSILGILVTYKRFCSASRQLQPKNVRKRSHGYDVLGQQQFESDSDETDIDAAVDEYKTQMYVSTVMQWNGSEVVNSNSQGDVNKMSVKVHYLLLGVSIVIFIMSLSLRWISNFNWFSLSISGFCFVIYNVLLFILWTHPQRLTSSNPTLKVPCVPWIPIGSSLFHCIMLFQLPALSWIVSLFWLLLGISLYFGYGYRKSRLNFKLRVSNPPESKSSKLRKNNKQNLRILPESMLNVTSSSIAVYPQPYYKI